MRHRKASDLQALAERVAHGSTLTTTDVLAVVDALTRFIAYDLCSGAQVTLDGLCR